ncbi:glycerate kinase [Bifidobacterium pseudolongum subsp. globosum]|uniref:Glycerate kinase n=1 Tax=Bifidobacterium pseudolongum subsp. globosum TaxID=1690 RepID=A0A8B3RND5_9BIFI|nr:glycerate kinase [Bifidobacterium pseudolongum]MCI6772838.1 glycerate kinase [Bifidobacterium pseudolongum]RYQ00246.1 glycerate kinase [Bifidobacterium pseudolongum subsp. globosum]RYQ45037.1 glycerate kinase [Bifidobacterium pseudolongum subsp. globosum]RYQ46437.1 glycerate kinase [Bifidobacterium pseudolongum subsp. globosum]RYQ55045.1 glycerate kinase [Bifidobacterium pseudolongum subsp. globosum]
MKIIIAPDSFKGCMSARQAAEAMEHGVHHVLPDAECVLVPMADGGEGTVQSLVDATGGTLLEATVTGPLGTPVHAQYGMLGDGCTAVIEMAAASGIGYVDETTRDPRITTTYGVGELILDALDHGVTAFILGLGGSATNDGGTGMAQALGAHLLDAQGNELPFGGAALAGLATIDVSDLDSRIATADIRLASDVTNPLTGPQGASSVFGPQKGADASMVAELDAALHHYASIVARDLGRDVETVPGAGAAGGLGAGFLAFTGARMQSGVSLVVEATGLKTLTAGADWCFTGEGGIDSQTQYGKTPIGVARAVKEAAPHCPVVAFAGNVGSGVEELYSQGIDAVFGIVPGPQNLRQALACGAENLERCAANVTRLIACTRGMTSRA